MPGRGSNENPPARPSAREPEADPRQARLAVFGEEMMAKKVGWSGKSGRVYLPLGWLGKRVKIIRVD